MWHNPSDKRKRAQTCPNIIWEPKDNEGKNSQVPKEAISAQSPSASRRTILDGFMERAEEDCRGKRRRPDESGGVNEPPAVETVEAKTVSTY